MNHDGNILEEIVKCWFLKPIRSKAMKIGSMNEKYVFTAIVGFLTNMCSSEIEVVTKPETFGLIVQQKSKWLATSVDGIIELKYKNSNEVFIPPLEIKTFSN